jgi:hypothetical protein
VTAIEQTTRPCRYCVAGWAAATRRIDGDPILPTAADCEHAHRDETRVYNLAHAMARAMQARNPSDEQVSYFLEDADEVVDGFDPAPERWRVRRLPACVNDAEDGIDVRLRINDVTYVALEGGKDCRGSVVPLAEFRKWRSS